MKPSLLTLAATPAALFAVSQTSIAQKKNLPPMAKPIGLVGIVAGQPINGEFTLRANAQTFKIKPLPEVVMSKIRGGDRVRVWGRPTGTRVTFANVRVLAERASSNPDDYNTPASAPIISEG